MNNKVTLYKRTNTGAIQQWTIELSQDQYRVISGQVGGKMVVSKWTTCDFTNEGRSNERSPSEQALFEVNSRVKKQLESGYHDSIQKIDDNKGEFKPMLAEWYEDYKKPMTFPKWIQPKLDGKRAYYENELLLSRNKKIIPSAPHIQEILSPLHKLFPEFILDGELYNHSLKYDFDYLMSLASTTVNLTKEFLQESSDNLMFYVFDLYDKSKPNANFTERYNLLNKCVRGISDKIKIVPAHLVNNQKQMDDFYHKLYLTMGYEGQMIRSDVPYRMKRTFDLIKRKEFIDDEFIIIDIVEGEGNRSGMAGNVVVDTKNGTTSEASISGIFKNDSKKNQEYFKELLYNKQKYIGLPANVRFQGYTKSGKLRFGSMKRIRVEE